MRIFCSRKKVVTRSGSETGIVVLINFSKNEENEIKKFLDIMNINIDHKRIEKQIIAIIREEVIIEETLIHIKTLENKTENIIRDTRHLEVALSMFDVEYSDSESRDLLREVFKLIKRIYLERIEVEAENLDKKIEVPERINLMRHQEIGAKYIIKSLENNRGFLLADDMRLGKTFTALAVVKTLNTKAIVITTKKTVDKWKEESNIFGVQGIVLNYESIEKLIEYVSLSKINTDDFGIIIFDEIHKIKNEESQTYRKCQILKQIFNKAKIIGMSGTILQNEPKEMMAILNMCNIDITPISDALRESEVTLPNGIKITKTSFINNRIYKVIKYLENGGFYLRRNVEDIGDEYSKNIERFVYRIVLSIEEKREIFEKVRDKISRRRRISSKEERRRIENLLETIFYGRKPDMSIRKSLLEQIGRYKFKRYLSTIRRMVDEQNQSVIIFSAFVETQNFCIEKLEELGYNVSKILGGQKQSEIIKEIKKFQNKESKIAVCSLRAASEGITLSAGTVTVFIDLDYNPAVIMQGENRMINIRENVKKRSIVLISDILYELDILTNIATKTRFVNLIQRQS